MAIILANKIRNFVSKNLKDNTPFQSYEDFVILVQSSDLCCGSYEQVLTQAL